MQLLIVAYFYILLLTNEVSVFGVLVNIFNIWFLLKERGKLDFTPSFGNLLIVLAVFDLIFLVFEIGIFGLPAISTWYKTNVYFKILPSWIGFVNIGRVGSVAVTVSIAIERYISVCCTDSSNYDSHLLLPVSIAFSILYNIPKFFELIPCVDTESNAQNSTNEASYDYTKNNAVTYTDVEEDQIQTTNNASMFCDPNGIRATPMRQNFWYIIFYTVLSKLLLIELIPWVTVIVLNYCIWRRLKEFHSVRRRTLRSNTHQGRASKQTRILMGVVLVFIFCQSFTMVADIYELTCCFRQSPVCQFNIHIERFIDVAHLVLAVNSSVNFVIYMIHIEQFRHAFLKVIWPCIDKQLESPDLNKGDQNGNAQNIEMVTPASPQHV